MATITGNIWSKIEFDLSEFRDLFQMRLETLEEAKGRIVSSIDGNNIWSDSAPLWEDEEHGKSIRAWLLIPHVDTVDRKSVEKRLKAGRRLITSVEQRVEAREMSLELLHDWGRLNQWAGALQLVCQMKPNARQLRAGSKNLEAHKRWFSYHFLRIQQRKKRDDVLDKMEELVNLIVGELPDGQEKQWFSEFLSPEMSDTLENARRLTKAFRKDLTTSKMKELNEHPLEDVPEFALQYPAP
jgi:hypothetical protein